ncbi:MAG: TolC family protein, partial [Paludibacter sp.]
MNIKHHTITIRILLTTIIVAGFVSCRSYKSLTQVNKPDVNTLVREGSQNNTDTIKLSSIPWKTYFSDEKLQKLISEGLDNGYNMKVALARIQQ